MDFFETNEQDNLKRESLAQLFDEFFESSDITFEITEGDIIDGVVSDVTDGVAIVNAGFKHDIFIYLKNESEEAQSFVEVGSPIFVLVIDADSNRRGYIGSVDAYIRKIKFDQILESIGDDTVAYQAKVVALIENAGYLVDIDGFSAFMPGSLSSMNKLPDFGALVGEFIPVMIINVDKQNSTLIASHKHYLDKLIPQAIEELEDDESYSGHITGLVHFGVFVEFNGCLTGLLHKSNFSEETLHKFEQKLLKKGDAVDFFVKEIVSDKRIILTQRNEPDVWKNFEEHYSAKSTYIGKVIKSVNTGHLIELERDVVGLCKNCPPNIKKGSTVNVKLIWYNTSRRQMGLDFIEVKK